MVQAMIHIPEQTNRVLSIVKAKHGLKDKSAAIELVVREYEQLLLEPQLRPSFITKVRRLQRKGVYRQYASIDQLQSELAHAKVQRRKRSP
jgi:hypothetical protein